MAMSYGHVYVARVAFGAKDAQTVKAFQEAEAYPGPSLIIAYSHCIAHGYDMAFGCEQQKLAVDSGSGRSTASTRGASRRASRPLQLDSGAAEDPRREVHAEREPLPHGRSGRSRALAAPRRGGRARGAAPAPALQAPLRVASRCRDAAGSGTAAVPRPLGGGSVPAPEP